MDQNIPERDRSGFDDVVLIIFLHPAAFLDKYYIFLQAFAENPSHYCMLLLFSLPQMEAYLT